MVRISQAKSGGGGRWGTTSPLTMIVVSCTLLALFCNVVFVIKALLWDDTSARLSSSSSSSSSSFSSPHRRLSQPNVGMTMNPVLRHLGHRPETIYKTLLENHPHPSKDQDFVVEVGAARLQQSTLAAQQGFSVVSFDASPANFAKMQTQHAQQPREIQQRLRIVHKAVSNVSGSTVKFASIGGTGDHVVGMDLDAAEKTKYQAYGEVVEVGTVSLDDFFFRDLKDKTVYILKIDVQGHETHVFSGMQRIFSSAAAKPRYILFEYWVDALDRTAGSPFGSCTAVKKILEPLMNANYELFDMEVQSHFKAGNRVSNLHTQKFYRPLDLVDNCQWYAAQGQVERKASSSSSGGKNNPTDGESAEETYDMGYWTDVLAVYRGEFKEQELKSESEGRKPSLIDEKAKAGYS